MPIPKNCLRFVGDERVMSSQAYTPGLKRKEVFLVRKMRRLPIPGEVLVKEGQTVYPDTIVARTNVPGEPLIVRVAHTIGVEPEEIEQYMLKKVGDSVEKDEAIALSSSFFGLFKKVCKSPAKGTVEHISNVTGQAIIREPPVPVEITAYIPGAVTKILPNEGVVVETSAAYIQGIFGVGGEAHGELMMAAESPDDILTAERIGPECADKILIGGALVTNGALHKSVEVGAKGIVVGGIRDKDLIDFVGYEIGVAITGHEELGLTLIVTEGFGEMRMAERTFRLLRKFSGKLACINGATQIRAGVMRPEVVIPREDFTLPQAAKYSKEAEFLGEGLRPGTPIRIIREPYFGALGHVVSLPIQLQYIETESDVRVLEAELVDGRRVIVPRANVEMIEE
ncbi:MAG: hypothetical protein AOA65_0871 [Candidatus Bathyarchaeota archaeon BA1]|nr:MAG: hypothetical protein AOA65_0871 [Candidatus Bathyarchaeota archaeon BA1]